MCMYDVIFTKQEHSKENSQAELLLVVKYRSVVHCVRSSLDKHKIRSGRTKKMANPERSTLDQLNYATTEGSSAQVVEDDGGVIKDSTEAELTKIRLMRASLESRDPSVKNEVDDFMIRRFLRARGLDVEKASAMFLKYWKWRRSFVPNGSISPSEVPNELAQNKMFAQGHDKRGRPITVVFGARHFQNRVGGLDEFKRFAVFGLDKLCARMPEGQEKFVGIGELKGWGYSNSDVRGYIAALTILQGCYPERLGKLFIVNAPYMFMKVWKIIYPFIDNETKKKIVFVENKKLKPTLLEDIDESQLPEIYGGQLPLIPIQDC